MTSLGCVHIVGAGLAGLAAAVRLTAEGRLIALYESSQHAGGRCRSYLDAEPKHQHESHQDPHHGHDRQQRNK